MYSSISINTPSTALSRGSPSFCGVDSLASDVSVKQSLRETMNSASEDNGLYRTRLEQLKSHPLFGDLQMTLALDCLQLNVPFTLLSENSSCASKVLKPGSSFCTVSDKILEQHVKLQNILLSVKPYFPSLLSVYQQITDQVESQRYRALAYNCYSDNVKQLINGFYDRERQMLIDRIHDMVQMIAVSKDSPETSNIEMSLIGMQAQNLGAKITLQPSPSKKPANSNADAENPLDLSNSKQIKCAVNHGEKKSRFLSKKAVSFLQAWYQKHRDHPYATDEEVKELAIAGGITPNQVKKWMANTRARSYNTLTYNGGKHFLNGKFSMKRRLMVKYKIDHKSLSDDHKLEESQESNTTNTSQTSNHDSDMEVEYIDVETVPDNESPNSLTEKEIKIEKNSSFSNKPSLEQVIARCIKSKEGGKNCSSTCVTTEETTQKSNIKTALENLKEVVNSVIPQNPNQSFMSNDCLPYSTSPSGKRYLSPHAKSILNEWFRKHLFRPYPTYEEKKELALRCGISSSKVDTWFANKRNRTQNTKKLPPKHSHVVDGYDPVTDS